MHLPTPPSSPTISLFIGLMGEQSEKNLLTHLSSIRDPDAGWPRSRPQGTLVLTRVQWEAHKRSRVRLLSCISALAESH